MMHGQNHIKFVYCTYITVGDVMHVYWIVRHVW